MPRHAVRLTHFSFPQNLHDNKADFRLQVDIRCREGGEFQARTMILPSVDTFWDCSEEANEKREPKEGRICVRKRNQPQGWLPEVDLDRAGPWACSFRLEADELYELRVTVFDVDNKSWLKSLGSALKGALDLFTQGLPGFVTGLAKPFLAEATTTIGRKMAGDDRVLLVHSATYQVSEDETSGTWSVARDDYKLEFRADKMVEPA
ncbi:MAG: hypothetical protein OXQ29_18410 [Rhodospirillaceae bacterium]|nr:hypothetical protein [Rhodospirillaceae bacterium]